MKDINPYKVECDDECRIKLDGNEIYKSIEEFNIDSISKNINLYKLNRYPDTNCNKLRECYGKIIGVESENIIVGNGSDEMIGLIISTIISKGKKVLILKPEFSMYEFYTKTNEGEVIEFPTNNDGSFCIAKFIELGMHEKPDLIIISNPNNPTGHVLDNTEIQEILISLPKSMVVIDEAYYEFYGQSIIYNINDFENLIVTRTLSKAWGMAALRIGFMIANKKIINKIIKYKVPYNVSQLSQDIACSVLNYPEIVLDNVNEIINERERVLKKLLDIQEKYNGKVFFYKSKANYIFGRSEFKNRIKRYLQRNGIIIRYFDDNSFRITIGKPLENDLVISCIDSILSMEREII